MRSAARSPARGRRRRGSFLIVGAPGAGPAHAGRTYVYKGLSSKPAFVIDADDTGAALGAMFLSVIGDVNGDGIPDVYASDFTNAREGAVDRPRLRPLRRGRPPPADADRRNAGRRIRDRPRDRGRRRTAMATTISSSAPGSTPAAAISGGRAYLYSGKDGALLKTYTCRMPGETFGFDAVGIGDIDGDGTIDFLITSAWSGIKGFHSGRMFVISSGVSRVTASHQDH